MTPEEAGRLIRETSYFNWDSEGAEPIEAADWLAAAVNMIRFVMQKDVSVSPCGDGSVHFSITSTPGEILTVEIKGEMVAATCRSPGGIFECMGAVYGIEAAQRGLAKPMDHAQ